MQLYTGHIHRLPKSICTVNYKILLRKMDKLGIQGKILAWFTSYLNDRSQCTLANGIQSPQSLVTCGVPQGSILGPLLFLIYINDITNTITNSNIKLYADDTVIYSSAKTINDAYEILQQDLSSMISWCKLNQLTINVNKTKAVLLEQKDSSALRHCRQLTWVMTRTVHFVGDYKYLGVMLDCGLNFEKHADAMGKLVSHKLYLLGKIRSFLTRQMARCIYKTKVLPYFDYGDIFYIDM